MITREVIKAEIDKIDDQYLELLYKIIKAMITPTDILERYLRGQSPPSEKEGSAFLSSIAGMFDSGPNNSSEQVDAIVTDMILQKHQGLKNDSPY